MYGSALATPVDKESAGKLMFQFFLQKGGHSCNLEARYYFERSLQPSGEGDAVNSTPSTAKHQIPYSGEPFRTGVLAKAAAQVFRQFDGSMKYATIRTMHRIADNWTPEGVVEATKNMEKETSYNFKQRLFIKREQMHVLLAEGIQHGDLEVNTLFLL